EDAERVVVAHFAARCDPNDWMMRLPSGTDDEFANAGVGRLPIGVERSEPFVDVGVPAQHDLHSRSSDVPPKGVDGGRIVGDSGREPRLVPIREGTEDLVSGQVLSQPLLLGTACTAAPDR